MLESSRIYNWLYWIDWSSVIFNSEALQIQFSFPFRTIQNLEWIKMACATNVKDSMANTAFGILLGITLNAHYTVLSKISIHTCKWKCKINPHMHEPKAISFSFYYYVCENSLFIFLQRLSQEAYYPIIYQKLTSWHSTRYKLLIWSLQNGFGMKANVST